MQNPSCCSSSGCPNYGNPKNQNLCNSCFKKQSMQCLNRNCSHFGNDKTGGLCNECSERFRFCTKCKKVARPLPGSLHSCQLCCCDSQNETTNNAPSQNICKNPECQNVTNDKNYSFCSQCNEKYGYCSICFGFTKDIPCCLINAYKCVCERCNKSETENYKIGKCKNKMCQLYGSKKNADLCYQCANLFQFCKKCQGFSSSVPEYIFNGCWCSCKNRDETGELENHTEIELENNAWNNTLGVSSNVSGLTEPNQIIKKSVSEINYRKCSEKECTKKGLESLGGRCASCFVLFECINKSEIHESASSNQCIVQGCAYFGSPKFGNKCSKCYDKEKLAKYQSLPNHFSDLTVAGRQKVCKTHGCNFYGDPDQLNMCSVCFRKYLFETGSSELTSSTTGESYDNNWSPSPLTQLTWDTNASQRGDSISVTNEAKPENTTLKPGNVSYERQMTLITVEDSVPLQQTDLKPFEQRVSSTNNNMSPVNYRTGSSNQFPNNLNDICSDELFSPGPAEEQTADSNQNNLSAPVDDSVPLQQTDLKPFEQRVCSTNNNMSPVNYRTGSSIPFPENLNDIRSDELFSPGPAEEQTADSNQNNLSAPVDDSIPLHQDVLNSAEKLTSSANNNMFQANYRTGSSVPFRKNASFIDRIYPENFNSISSAELFSAGPAEEQTADSNQNNLSAPDNATEVTTNKPSRSSEEILSEKVELAITQDSIHVIKADYIVCMWSQEMLDMGPVHPLLQSTGKKLKNWSEFKKRVKSGQVMNTDSGLQGIGEMLHSVCNNKTAWNLTKSIEKIVPVCKDSSVVVVPFCHYEVLSKNAKATVQALLRLVRNIERCQRECSIRKIIVSCGSKETKDHLDELISCHSRTETQKQLCISCKKRFAAKIRHLSRHCDEACPNFCIDCLRQSWKNPLNCSVHGRCFSPVGHENCFALIIAGHDSDKASAEIFINDANLMKETLQDPNIIGIRKENIKLITTSKPALSDHSMDKKVIEAFREFHQQIHKKEHPFFLLYFTGHNNHISLHFGDRFNRMTPKQLKKELQSLNAEKVMIILDCCYSGGVDLTTFSDEDFTKSLQSIESKDNENYVLLPKLWNLEDECDGLGAKKDRTTVKQWTSSVTEQRSFFHRELNNSLFTLCITNLLKGQCPVKNDQCEYCQTFHLTAREEEFVFLNNLHECVVPHVEKLVHKYNKEQQPQLEGNDDEDMAVAFYLSQTK